MLGTNVDLQKRLQAKQHSQAARHLQMERVRKFLAASRWGFLG